MFCGTFFSLKKFSICTFSPRFETKECQNLFFQLLACITLQGQVTEEELRKKPPKTEVERRNTAVEKVISIWLFKKEHLRALICSGIDLPAELGGLVEDQTCNSFSE